MGEDDGIMSIVGLCGAMGTGKTLRMSMLLKQLQEEGLNIKANYDLKFPSVKIDPDEMIKFSLNDCAVGLTEATTFLDSRINSDANRYQSYFIFQTRKKSVMILYDAQIIGSMDLRLRTITNRIYECAVEFVDPTIINIKKRFHPDNIVCFTYNMLDESGRSAFETLSIDDAKQYFNIYDTREVILPKYMTPVSIKDFDKLIELFDNSKNRDVFVALARKTWKYLAYDDTRAIYTLLKDGDESSVKEILGLK